jgi:parvulin-like peptidyl-prolyl isomerase
MLETLRRNSRSIFIYLIFGALILAFILTFGPQGVQARRGGRGQAGCGSATPAAAAVNGGEISDTSWRWALLVATQGSPSSQRARRDQIRERVLDQLFVRELFAQRGAELGFAVSDDEVRERLTSGDFYFLGSKVNGKSRYFVQDSPEDPPRFSARALDLFAKQYTLPSVDKLVDEQKKELLAMKVRELILAGVRVSPEEVEQRYQQENTKADVAFVTFAVGPERQKLEVAAADVDAYLKAHEADLKAQYDKEADRWKGRDKEVRVRDLFVKTERPPAENKPAEGADKAAPPAPAPDTRPDPARPKADAALARVKKGEDFAAVVRSLDATASRGGDLGWRPLRGLRLGKPVADAVEKLAKGASTDVVEVPEGYHIVQLVDSREGDLTFDQVKHDLAEDGLRDEKAKATTKAAADKALAAAQAGTPLDKQFPGEGEKTGTGPHVQKAAGVGRIGGFVQGLGTAPDLVKAIFDEGQTKVGVVAPKVFEVSGDYVVVLVEKREQPDMTKFEAEKAKLAAEMAETKAQVTLSQLAGDECRRAKDAGRLSFDPSLVEYGDAEKAPKSGYLPCITLR